jgi:hypothetical protein
MEITLQTPNSVQNALLEYISDQGNAGCQGMVRPAKLIAGGVEKIVQVKEFFSESIDDRGDSFRQNPDAESHKSYNALNELSSKGFKVIPYFGLAKTKQGKKLLVLEDLTKQGALEVHDQKHVCNNREIADLLMECVNWSEVQLDFLRNSLLKKIHKITLGNGVEAMITRDPKTNRAEMHVTDVGEYCYYSWPGRISEVLKPEDFEHSSPFRVYANIVRDEKLAKDIFQRYREEHKTKKLFMDLAQTALIVESFESLHAGGPQHYFAKANFRKANFHDDSILVKMSFDKMLFHYKSCAGHDLFDWNSKTRAEFANALSTKDESGLMKGVDYAYLICLDRDLLYLDSVRTAEKQVHRPRISNRLMKFSFLEEEDERIKEPILNIGCTLLDFGNKRHIRADIVVDWKTGYDYANHSPFPIFIVPEQVVGIYDCQTDFENPPYYTKKLMPGFDSEKVSVEIYGEDIFYRHDNFMFHFMSSSDQYTRMPSLESLKGNPRIKIKSSQHFTKQNTELLAEANIP